MDEKGARMATEFVQVVTTTDSKAEAQKIAEALVRRRVAGCVQVVGPIVSTYWWNEEIETAEEWLCLIKTAQDRFDALEQAIREVHSYDVPEILAMPVIAGHVPYLEWLRNEVRNGSG